MERILCISEAFSFHGIFWGISQEEEDTCKALANFLAHNRTQVDLTACRGGCVYSTHDSGLGSEGRSFHANRSAATYWLCGPR